MNKLVKVYDCILELVTREGTESFEINCKCKERTTRFKSVYLSNFCRRKTR